MRFLVLSCWPQTRKIFRTVCVFARIWERIQSETAMVEEKNSAWAEDLEMWRLPLCPGKMKNAPFWTKYSEWWSQSWEGKHAGRFSSPDCTTVHSAQTSWRMRHCLSLPGGEGSARISFWLLSANKLPCNEWKFIASIWQNRLSCDSSIELITGEWILTSALRMH